MVRWLRWHCPPDTGSKIRALAVWGRTRYLSVTEAPHNTDFHTWMGKKHFCFFQTAATGNRTPNSGVKGSGANHHPRAPAHFLTVKLFNWNFHPLELVHSSSVFCLRPHNRAVYWTSCVPLTRSTTSLVVSNWRDPQLQVGENYTVWQNAGQRFEI